jgi:hypothetical protein
MYRAQYGHSLIGSPEAIIEALIRSSVMPLARLATPLREASYGGEVINLIPSESKYSRLRACISSLALSQKISAIVAPWAFICRHHVITSKPSTALVSEVATHWRQDLPAVLTEMYFSPSTP